MPGFKGERYNRWLNNVLNNVSDGIKFPSTGSKTEFKARVLPQIGKPSNYYVPSNMKSLIAQLNSNGIGWGVIANESHLYQAVLKTLGLGSSMGPLVLASDATMFKPLPKMWARAIERVPVASKHDVWFIGSSSMPCDNMSLNPQIRCVLVKPDLAVSDPVSQHFRIKSVDELVPYLIKQPAPDLNFLEIPTAEQAGEDSEVSVSSYVPPPPPSSSSFPSSPPPSASQSSLPLGEPEMSAAVYLDKYVEKNK